VGLAKTPSQLTLPGAQRYKQLLESYIEQLGPVFFVLVIKHFYRI
jgi:hypothetical protein